MEKKRKGETLLNAELCQEMKKIIEEITTSGKSELDAALIKQLKGICKQADGYVDHAFHLLMTQLEKEHSEIRVSSLFIINELFLRSNCFRELLLADFQEFMKLTLEIDYELPLPPPKPAAKQLKEKTVEFIQQWQDKFGEAYKKLSLGYHFLKNCKKVDFENYQARSRAEIMREEERRIRQDYHNKEKLKSILEEMKELQKEIESCMIQVKNCLELLVPNPENFSVLGLKSPEAKSFSHHPLQSPRRQSTSASTLRQGSSKGKSPRRKSRSSFSLDESNPQNSHKLPNKDQHAVDGNLVNNSVMVSPSEGNLSPVASTSGVAYISQASDESDDDSSVEEFSGSSDDEEEKQSMIVQEHGLGTQKYSLSILLPEPGIVRIQESADNTDLLNNMKDIVSLIGCKYLPSVNKWLEIFAKCGGEQADIKKALDIKNELEETRKIITGIKVTQMKKADEIPQTAHDEEDEEEEDDDFVEVPMKEGYEEHIPEHLREEYGLVKKPQRAPTSRNWSFPKTDLSSNMQEMDPTTWLPTVKKIKETLDKSKHDLSSKSAGAAASDSSTEPQPSTSSGVGESEPDLRKLFRAAPLIPYSTDLYYWGQKDVATPMFVRNDNDSHRFWRPIDNDEEVDQKALAEMRSRVINFTGHFQPVKWKCRAPLPNGKLCERMDRKKCPFHGVIIPRNVLGEPTRPEDIEKLAKEKEIKEKAEANWDDPELQQEIQAATGVNLQRKKSKKRKKKHPNLTDINKINNTTRNRLKSKVLNKSSLKRVAAAMDNLDHKRFKDKFANQFNYAM